MTGERRRLIIKTLGQDQVILDGQPLHWPSRATRDLFSILLLSLKGWTKFDLVGKIWGDEASKEANGNFKVTLHRLRLALDDKSAIIEHEGRYSLSSEYLDCADHVQMQAKFALARAAATRDECLKWLSEAVAMYGGDYLPDQIHDWAEETRIMLRTLYAHATIELASLHCGAVECYSAIRHLATGLATEPLVGEHHHQTLMTCLCTLGRSDDAIGHYRHYRSFLQHEIGDTPTGATVRLADQIRNLEAHESRQIGGPSGCPRRLLYGHLPPIDTSWQPPDLPALARELGRGHLMLDLLTEIGEASEWGQVAASVERLITATMPGTSAILLRRVDLSQPLDLQSGRVPAWPDELVRAVTETLKTVNVLTRGSRVTVQTVGGVAVLFQGIGSHTGPPDAWLGAARLASPSEFSSEEQEVLARVAQLLSHMVSQAVLEDPTGRSGTLTAPHSEL